jgi:hypothetical protein
MRECGAPVSETKKAQDISYSRTFEPLLAGDRQTARCVAKARYALKWGPLEVSLS